MKIYIAGIMQGSRQDHDIQGQDYRQLIREAVQVHHPEAEFYDPFSRFPDSVTFDERRANEALFEMADAAGSADMVIAYLPQASMGTALEMIRAYDNGKTVISISPMAKNWLIRAVSARIFPSLDEFCTWARHVPLTKLINASAFN